MKCHRLSGVTSTTRGILFAVSVLLCAGFAVGALDQSITSTSQNRPAAPAAAVAEQPRQGQSGYQIVVANDLGMHCADLDHRIATILPPFNVLHAQALRKGGRPQILGPADVEIVYSAASNPLDPALSRPFPGPVYKTNFWDLNPRGTGNSIAFDAYKPHYPPGVLELFPLQPDHGLPVPDLQRLYLGDHQLVADRQAMPSAVSTSPFVTQPYSANVPQKFALFYSSFPFFISFPFGYTLPAIRWFSAEGIPLAPFDDAGRPNEYPLLRVQARAVPGNRLGVSAGTVLASLDTVAPVAGEVECQSCHTSATDGGNGMATDGRGFRVATRFDDPQFGAVPEAVSIEYAFDLNVLRLHDRRHSTNLEQSTPISCQTCHYTPALDLAHVGPKGPGDSDANGRQQTLNQTFSRVMHSFHGQLTKADGTKLFPEMPSPVGRSVAERDRVLTESCYTCHPGRVTQCFRGAMANAGLACQDCHGGLSQVGNDFSRNVSPGNPGAFILAGDYYTNPATPRVPWANEPMCQSCHTGDVLRNLANSSGTVKSSDNIRLLQAFRTSDANAKPIVALNRRFAENQSSSKQILYRLSKGHGGVFCQGCHGSTHAEWPNAIANANDNVAALQLQGHAGTLTECKSCHGPGSFQIDMFKRNFDSGGMMKGPHGMHPVDDPMWGDKHGEVFKDSATPRGACQACHGAQLEGAPLARAATTRSLECKDEHLPGCAATSSGKRIVLTAGTQVSCNLCHKMPSTGD